MTAGPPTTRDEWERLEELIRRILRPLVPDVDDLDDVTQLCLIAVWRGAASFASKAAFSTWLYRVVRNQHISWARRQARRAKRDRQASMNWWPPAANALEASVLDRIATDHLLAGFPGDTRLMLELICYRDHTAVQIADELGLAPSSVRCRLHRLRRRWASQSRVGSSLIIQDAGDAA